VLLTWSPSNGLQAVVALSPQAWFRYGVGITVTGAGVSTWADQSGLGHDLLQATDAARPALQADGSILFDGVDDLISASGFTLTLPYTIYLLGRQVSWTGNDRIFSGTSGSDVVGTQVGASPDVTFSSGGTSSTTEWLVGVYAALAIVFDAVDITVRVNNNAPSVGSGATNNMEGFQLAVYTDGAQQFGNIQYKEVILYSGAHTTTQQSQVINYLSRML